MRAHGTCDSSPRNLRFEPMEPAIRAYGTNVFQAIPAIRSHGTCEDQPMDHPHPQRGPANIHNSGGEKCACTRSLFLKFLNSFAGVTAHHSPLPRVLSRPRHRSSPSRLRLSSRPSNLNPLSLPPFSCFPALPLGFRGWRRGQVWRPWEAWRTGLARRGGQLGSGRHMEF